MSSINPFYTLSYQQPEEYRFSHDSVFLARRVFELVSEHKLPTACVLDLCAGCGVVGIDYLLHWQTTQTDSVMKLDFIEVQEVYQKHFVANINQVQNLKAFQFLTMNYDQVFTLPELQNKYDLILSNPPYFEKHLGALSDSEFKNRCRFFIDSNFVTLLKAVQYLLKPKGNAFLLLKDLKTNGHDINDELRRLELPLNITQVEKIRTTDLFRIQLI